MFKEHTKEGYIQAFEGIERKTLVHGDKTLMSEFRMKKNSALPMHSHPHEQTGYLVSGRMQLQIASERFDVRPGDSWCIPGDVAHGANIIDDAVAVEVFSPTRGDYLPDQGDG